jgi:hypothetical protein
MIIRRPVLSSVAATMLLATGCVSNSVRSGTDPGNAGGGGVCSGGDFLPGTLAGSVGCLAWGCGDGNSDPRFVRTSSGGMPPADWTGVWLCGVGVEEAGVGANCGPKPPDYDGCMQWSCDSGAWRGTWVCWDCPTVEPCHIPDASPGCAALNQPYTSCNTSVASGLSSRSCYCGNGGNWECKPSGFCVDASSGDLDGG